MSRRKPLAALAAVTAALALAVPVASANAAPTGHAVRTASIGAGSAGLIAPNRLLCSLLEAQWRTALRFGQVILARLLANTEVRLGCLLPTARP